MQDFPVPNVGTAAIHSAVPGAGRLRVARRAGLQQDRAMGSQHADRSPNTRIRIFRAKKEWAKAASKHTLRLDPSGNVWSSGVPLTKFDPETRKFTHFDEVQSLTT